MSSKIIDGYQLRKFRKEKDRLCQYFKTYDRVFLAEIYSEPEEDGTFTCKIFDTTEDNQLVIVKPGAKSYSKSTLIRNIALFCKHGIGIGGKK